MLALTAILVWVSLPCNAAADPATGFSPFRQAEAAQAQAEPEKIYSGPKDIKERIAIFVFLGWLWLSILVLIYVLRLKIRESDRLNNLGYFETDNNTAPPEG
jgi:hypothetical protein